MAQSIGVPIVGVVDIMSYFIYQDCDKRHIIFGDNHANEVVETTNAPLLIQLPMDQQIAALYDAGKIEDVNIASIPEFLHTSLKRCKLNRRRKMIDTEKLQPAILEKLSTVYDPKTVAEVVRMKLIDDLVVD